MKHRTRYRALWFLLTATCLAIPWFPALTPFALGLFVSAQWLALTNEISGDTFTEFWGQVFHKEDLFRYTVGLALGVEVALFIHPWLGALVIAWLPIHFFTQRLWF